jgi:glycosyltransferase involved in cell wall biosynthesis
LGVLSVVVTIYNKAGQLDELWQRLEAVLSTLTSDWEVLFVEDCGQDDSWEKLQGLASSHHRLSPHRTPRNLGQMAAIAYGLERCQGQWVVVMDGDLEHPPEVIAKFWDRRNSGADAVLGLAVGGKHPTWRRFFSRVFNRISKVGEGGRASTYSLLNRHAVDGFLSSPGAGKVFIRALEQLPLTRHYESFQVGACHQAQSSYTPTKLIKLALTTLWFQVRSRFA